MNKWVTYSCPDCNRSVNADTVPEGKQMYQEMKHECKHPASITATDIGPWAIDEKKLEEWFEFNRRGVRSLEQAVRIKNGLESRDWIYTHSPLEKHLRDKEGDDIS